MNIGRKIREFEKSLVNQYLTEESEPLLIQVIGRFLKKHNEGSRNRDSTVVLLAKTSHFYVNSVCEIQS